MKGVTVCKALCCLEEAKCIKFIIYWVKYACQNFHATNKINKTVCITSRRLEGIKWNGGNTSNKR